jgi:hypothetical protein
VRTFCVEHLKKGSDTRFQIPLEGKFVVARFAGGSSIIDAKGIERWKKVSGKWIKIDETGEIPVYPEIWHFPRDDFPR